MRLSAIQGRESTAHILIDAILQKYSCYYNMVIKFFTGLLRFFM
jgi:hypothetical protein